MTYPPQHPDDEPRPESFRPVSYDLAPEYGTPPPVNNPGPYGPPPVAPQPAQGYPAQSYPAQVYPAQPAPAYPVSGQPAPGFPAPGYPPPGFAPPVPPKKKGKGLRITLAVVGGVFLVCAVLACVFVYPYYTEGNAHVTTPPTLPGGLSKDSSDSATKLANSAESSLRNNVSGLKEVATGVYTSAGDTTKLVVVAAGTGTFFSPSSEVDSAFKDPGGSSSQITIGAATSYDAGQLGGTVKCAEGQAGAADTSKFAICVWADHGSIGLAFFFGRTASDAAPLFIQIREAVQTRS